MPGRRFHKLLVWVVAFSIIIECGTYRKGNGIENDGSERGQHVKMSSYGEVKIRTQWKYEISSSEWYFVQDVKYLDCFKNFNSVRPMTSVDAQWMRFRGL